MSSEPHKQNSNLSSTHKGGEQASLSLLVAASENNVIGIDNKLPWHLPNDLKYFKNQTWGLPILMGRKTFESIGKPLPGRKSIVITRNPGWQHDGVSVVHSVDEAIAKASDFGVKEIFVIGGAEIFKTSFASANRIYRTRSASSVRWGCSFPPNSWK
jgi:dihydrofolate reductase